MPDHAKTDQGSVEGQQEEGPQHTGLPDGDSLSTAISPEVVQGDVCNVSTESAAEAPPLPAAEKVYRHSLPVRLAHWLNVICLPILVMTGFQIFNAHQALYWGERSDRDRPILSIKAVRAEHGEVKRCPGRPQRARFT